MNRSALPPSRTKLLSALAAAAALGACATSGTSGASIGESIKGAASTAASSVGTFIRSAASAVSSTPTAGGASKNTGSEPASARTSLSAGSSGVDSNSPLAGAAAKLTAFQDKAVQSSDNGSAGQSALVKDKLKTTSVVFDPKCKQVVAPFGLTQNLSELASVTGDILGNNTVAVADNKLSGKKNTAATGGTSKQLKHNIPKGVRGAAKNMNWLPMSAEVAWGNYLLESKEEAGEIMPPESSQGEAVYHIAQRIVDELNEGVKGEHPYEWKVRVTKESSNNAAALPGGILLIDKGLLDQPKNLQKAYFAVAHEMAHVLQRHETRATQARIVDTISLTGTAKDMWTKIRETREKPSSIVGLLAAGKMLFEKHSSDQELQSDACAIRLLETALKDPKRMVAAASGFAASLPKPQPEAPMNKAEALVDFVTRPIDRHPTTQQRISNLQNMIVEVGRLRVGLALENGTDGNSSRLSIGRRP